MNKSKTNNDYLQSQGDIHKYDHIKSNLLWGKHPDDPRFSIYIPTYKRLELLKQSLDCAINQKEIDDYEIVIVDNDNDIGHTEVIDYIKKLNCQRIVYYKNEENIGIYGNTLRGATLSQGEFVALLNDDDLLHPYYLYVMNRFIDKFGYFGVLGSVPHEFRDDDYMFPPLPRGIFAFKVSKKEFFFGCSVTSPGIMYSRSVLEEIYNAHEDLLMGDQIIQYKGLINYGLYFVCFPIAAYRINDNATLKNDVLEKMMIHMCSFRKQTSKEDLFLKWFVLLFYKEYCNWYVTSSTIFWKKRSIKRQILKKVGVKKDIDNTIKSMITRTIIHKVHAYYGRLRGSEHDTILITDTIMKRSEKQVKRWSLKS